MVKLIRGVFDVFTSLEVLLSIITAQTEKGERVRIYVSSGGKTLAHQNGTFNSLSAFVERKH